MKYLVKAWVEEDELGSIFLEVEANGNHEAEEILRKKIIIKALEVPCVKS